MATKQCSRCLTEKPVDQFHKGAGCKFGVAPWCKECEKIKCREYRARVANRPTHRYEKTKRGFLMRLYRNMQSRVSGVQWLKHHLYAGKSLLPRAEFYEWSLASPDFHRLFAAWEAASYDRRLTPSVDRIDSSRGYELDNLEWTTHSENSRRGNLSRQAAARR